MNKSLFSPSRLSTACLAILCALLLTTSYGAAQMYTPTPNDTLQSLSIGSDHRVAFRIYAPRAESVWVGGSDIPENIRKDRMTRHDNGVWEVVLGPVAPGAYRYNFVVDRVSVLDPRNGAVSESNMNAWSLLYVPGADFMDIRDVPHGAVSVVTYSSTALQRFRRMHVYTPPGYESGHGRFPVFYLLHGAFDTDDAWTSVGRAGFILDNLIAEKKAVPMIVVMPAGHTGPFPFSGFSRPAAGPQRDEFVEDFLTDIKPYVEKHYRTLTDRDHRAIAGLSMGGAQSLNIAIPHLADYAYVGVFSSGILELGGRGPFGPPEKGPSWEERNLKSLDNKELKKGLRLLWFATGKEDFLLGISEKSVELLKKHGFDVVYKETAGAHTWTNWREYLAEFAPLLFRPQKH
jgi:enterochelin esterase-like enzyme